MNPVKLVSLLLVFGALVLFFVSIDPQQQAPLAKGSPVPTSRARNTAEHYRENDDTASNILSITTEIISVPQEASRAEGNKKESPVDAVNSGKEASSVQDERKDREQVALTTKKREKGPWEGKLYTPTFIDKVLGFFFIVDCWHHRVIYSKRLDAPISEWDDLDEYLKPAHKTMRIPHSVATDGKVLVVESSVGGSKGKGHSLLVYHPKEANGGAGDFGFVQELEVCPNDAAKRPHRVIYDQETNAFYLYMTNPPTLAKYERNPSGLELTRVFCHVLPFMKNIYARSITIVNSTMYITSGPGVIWSVDFSVATEKKGPKAIKAYSTKALGFMKGKMNDLTFIDGWWYATCTVPCNIVRFRDINNMGKHQRLARDLGMCGTINRRETRCKTGTPYFLTKMDDRIFVPYIFGCSGVVSFVPGNEEKAVTDLQHHWEGGWVEKADDLTVRTENEW